MYIASINKIHITTYLYNICHHLPPCMHPPSSSLQMWCLKACTTLLSIRTQVYNTPHKLLTNNIENNMLTNANLSTNNNLVKTNTSHGFVTMRYSLKDASSHPATKHHCLLSTSQMSFYTADVSMLRRFAQEFDRAWISNTVSSCIQ